MIDDKVRVYPVLAVVVAVRKRKVIELAGLAAAARIPYRPKTAARAHDGGKPLPLPVLRGIRFAGGRVFRFCAVDGFRYARLSVGSGVDERAQKRFVRAPHRRGLVPVIDRRGGGNARKRSSRGGSCRQPARKDGAQQNFRMLHFSPPILLFLPLQEECADRRKRNRSARTERDRRTATSAAASAVSVRRSRSISGRFPDCL